VQANSQPPILIDDGLDVFGVNIRAITLIVASRRPKIQRKGRRTGCTQGSGLAARQPVDRGRRWAGSSPNEPSAASCDRSRGASLIVDVVIGSVCQHVQPADGANDLAFRVDLEVMDEGLY